MEATMSGLRIPEYVHGAAAQGGSVVLNLRSGRWYSLNATAEQLWHELRRTGDLDEAVRTVAAGYPPHWTERIRADAKRLVTELADRRLIVLDSRLEPPRAERSRGPSTPAIAQELVTGGTPRGRARVALVLSLVLLRLPFRWTVWFVTVAKRRWCRAEATVTETAEILVAVAAVASGYPGRLACLENSLSAVLTAILGRRRMDWTIGVADDPIRFHAWVETAGVPVLPAPEPDFHEYRRVLTL